MSICSMTGLALLDCQTSLNRDETLQLVNANSHKEAAEQFARWNKAKGIVLAGLTKHRANEAKLFLQ